MPSIAACTSHWLAVFARGAVSVPLKKIVKVVAAALVTVNLEQVWGFRVRAFGLKSQTSVFLRALCRLTGDCFVRKRTRVRIVFEGIA